MPKIWDLQPIPILSTWTECRLVPSRNMARSTLKRGQRSWVWVNEVKKLKWLYEVYLGNKSKLWILWTTGNCVEIMRVFKMVLFVKRVYFRVRKSNGSQTRQIRGIWKLRPAYSPETPNLGQNRWCFVPCDLEIWWITLENKRASFLCCFKLCATFIAIGELKLELQSGNAQFG